MFNIFQVHEFLLKPGGNTNKKRINVCCTLYTLSTHYHPPTFATCAFPCLLENFVRFYTLIYFPLKAELFYDLIKTSRKNSFFTFTPLLATT